jgi:hypothetical protein
MILCSRNGTFSITATRGFGHLISNPCQVSFLAEATQGSHVQPVLGRKHGSCERESGIG